MRANDALDGDIDAFESPLDCGLPRHGETGPAPGGTVALADALRALANAGLPEDALRLAVEAILRSATVSRAASPKASGGP